MMVNDDWKDEMKERPKSDTKAQYRVDQFQVSVVGKYFTTRRMRWNLSMTEPRNYGEMTLVEMVSDKFRLAPSLIDLQTYSVRE